MNRPTASQFALLVVSVAIGYGLLKMDPAKSRREASEHANFERDNPNGQNAHLKHNPEATMKKNKDLEALLEKEDHLDHKRLSVRNTSKALLQVLDYNTLSKGLETDDTPESSAEGGLETDDTLESSAEGGLETDDTPESRAEGGLETDDTSESSAKGLKTDDTPESSAGGMQADDSPESSAEDLETDGTPESMAEGMETDDTPKSSAEGGLETDDTSESSAEGGLETDDTPENSAEGGLETDDSPESSAEGGVPCTTTYILSDGKPMPGPKLMCSPSVKEASATSGIGKMCMKQMVITGKPGPDQSKMLSTSCDGNENMTAGLCEQFGNPKTCCTAVSMDGLMVMKQQIICSDNDFDQPLSEKDFENCNEQCQVPKSASGQDSSHSTGGVVCTISTSLVQGTKIQKKCSPENREPGSIGKMCAKIKIVLGVYAQGEGEPMLNAGCDGSPEMPQGICETWGNPKDCCQVPLPEGSDAMKQYVICSGKDFDEPVTDKDFEKCNKQCVVGGAGVFRVSAVVALFALMVSCL